MNIVLLSGGSGKRLWPLSNDIRSKQFIKIFKKEDGTYESMVQRVYRQICEVDPDATVTREEMALMLTRLAKLMGLYIENAEANFSDKSLISEAALSSVAFCQKKGYINGKEHGFDPKGNATRAEVSTIIYRYLTSLTMG